MMTRVLLTFLVGLVVSLGALVSGGSGVALAGNWNSSTQKKVKTTPSSNTSKQHGQDYNSFFGVLDDYVSKRINSGKGTTHGSAGKRYPGYWKLNKQPNKAFVACIDWKVAK